MERNGTYVAVSHPLSRSNSLIENGTVAYPTNKDAQNAKL